MICNTKVLTSSPLWCFWGSLIAEVEGSFMQSRFWCLLDWQPTGLTCSRLRRALRPRRPRSPDRPVESCGGSSSGQTFLSFSSICEELSPCSRFPDQWTLRRYWFPPGVKRIQCICVYFNDHTSAVFSESKEKCKSHQTRKHFCKLLRIVSAESYICRRGNQSVSDDTVLHLLSQDQYQQPADPLKSCCRR